MLKVHKFSFSARQEIEKSFRNLYLLGKFLKKSETFLLINRIRLRKLPKQKRINTGLKRWPRQKRSGFA